MSPGSRILSVLVASVLAAGLGACTRDPEAPARPDPNDARWALTAADIGTGTTTNRSLKHFAQQACGAASTLGDWAVSLPFKNTESIGVDDVDGDINVVSTIVQIDGISNETNRVSPRPVEEMIRNLWMWTSDDCLNPRTPESYPDRVSYEMLGQAPDFDAKPFEPAFGFKAVEAGPWATTNEEYEKNPGKFGEFTFDLETDLSRQVEGVTEWFTVVWFTVAGDSSIVMVAAEGPRDPTPVLDFPALLATVANRVNDDPPDPEWDWTS